MLHEIPVRIASDVLSREDFEIKVQSMREPCVLKSIDIGKCITKWTPQYLCSQSGEKVATVHVSSVPNMDFVEKNFSYQKITFGELVKRASETTHENYFDSSSEFYYFRSIAENCRKDVSNISLQFPELKNDIEFPAFFPDESFFSSVFRIASAGMKLWTHYDIMDNLLIQVNGSKKVVLFPPSDALNLYLKEDKSLVNDIDTPDLNRFPKFANVTRYSCVLGSGDILYIPALWFHNVTALDFGIAVNVFWKNLPAELYNKKDPYGNKDLVPALRSMDIMCRALKVLEDLPEDYRDFYGRRMISKIESKCLKKT